jgi:serine protease Do
MKALLPLLFFTGSVVLAEEKPAPKDSESAKENTAPRLEEVGVDRYGKKSPEVLEQYAPTVAEARLSTAQVFVRGSKKPLALATVVSGKGYLISKASELEGKEDLEVQFPKSAMFPTGLRLSAKLIDSYRPYDLGLVQVAATGLKPAVFSTASAPIPGTFLSAVGLEETPVTFGVASVAPRNLDEANKGFLGILLRPTDSGLAIERITPKSAAADAGLKKDDIVLKINGSGISSVDEFVRTVGGYKPTERINILIKRASEEMTVDAVLRRRGEFPEALQRFEDPRNSISGPLSDRRTGFPEALQHDLFLKPSECGGPLTNLNGEIVGINIAHSGRTESLAIPSAAVATLLKNVDEGKFYYPELDELRKSKSNLEAEMKRLDDMESRLKKELEEIGKKLEAITGK